MLNNVRKHDLLVQRAMKKRFIFFSSLLFYCLALIFIIELLIALECVAELFLYYGKCIFPVLYGISQLINLNFIFQCTLNTSGVKGQPSPVEIVVEIIAKMIGISENI